MNSTIYMFKSIPTKDSQFPQLLKCFEMEFGPQKSRVLVPLYPLLSLSRLPISSFGQEGCREKILYDMGEILKNFTHLKNILCPPTPCSIHNEYSLSWAQKLWLPSVASKCEHETKKHVLIGCQTWHVLPPNIWSLTAVKANCRAKGKLFVCFWSARSAHNSFFSTFMHISLLKKAHLPPEIILNV